MKPDDCVRINVAKEFTRLPGNRYIEFGPFSGEEFREKFLMPPLEAHKNVIVELDGVRGYGSSFLDEAFGGAVKKLKLKPNEILVRIRIETSIESWKDEVISYMMEQAKNN